jgi:glycosyltransferase involved in cell wall biosynthesis
MSTVREQDFNDRLASDPRCARTVRRVLLISHHFPPVGGAGVQRPVKFAKYLRNFGWDVSVLTASNPSVPVFDESLAADIPEHVIVERARTWEPGYRLKSGMAANAASVRQAGIVATAKGWARRAVRGAAMALLQPDVQILWTPSAYLAASRLLSRLRHDVILATAPPYSSLVLGRLLSKRFGLPLVLDYRDEWDLSSRYLENTYRGLFSRVLQNRMQRSVLRQASAIVATTQASAARLESRASEAGSHAEVGCVYNGYDADDFLEFASVHDARSSERAHHRLVYTGTLWNLTNVDPLVKAIELLAEKKPDILRRLELCFVGRKTPQQQSLLDCIAAVGCRVEFEDYCDHDQALQQMASADTLCLLLSDVPGAERVVPAKLFEYLAARKEILAIVPDGETARIVRRFCPESQFSPGETRAIADWIAARVEGGLPTVPSPTDDESIRQFSRESQAQQLASLLNRAQDHAWM